MNYVSFHISHEIQKKYACILFSRFNYDKKKNHHKIIQKEEN